MATRTAVGLDTIGLKDNRAKRFRDQLIRLPFSADGAEARKILAV